MWLEWEGLGADGCYVDYNAGEWAGALSNEAAHQLTVRHSYLVSYVRPR